VLTFDRLGRRLTHYGITPGGVYSDRRWPLAGEKVADGVREVILESEDQALALRNFARFGSFSLESPEFGDVASQVGDQPVERSFVAHEPAS
jgi:hypothetical protein